MKLTRIIRHVQKMHQVADSIRAAGLRLALVPTMGFLHEGHLSLIRRARRCADRVVVSIFVNPKQFGPREDLSSYPRDFERDMDLVSAEGVALVFAPAVEEIYPQGYATTVSVSGLTAHLCGALRPGHFEGVATVVAKLFAATKPHVAVFGQKDAQQAAVIQRMTRDLNLDVDVLVSPTVREPDGLAKSSRNRYLSPEERQQATVLYQALQEGERQVHSGTHDAETVLEAIREMIRSRPLAKIDYVEAVSLDDLAPVEAFSGDVLLALAVKFGRARLIDNRVIRASRRAGPAPI